MYLARVEETLLSLNEPKSLSGSHFLRKNFKLYNRSRLLLVCGTNSEKKKEKLLRKNPEGQKRFLFITVDQPTLALVKSAVMCSVGYFLNQPMN